MRRLSSLLALVVLCFAGAAQAAPQPLNIKVIQAHNNSKSIDPRLEKLVKEWKHLSFTAYELKDEAEFNLDIGSVGRMQIPNGEWMSIVAQELAPDGKLKLELTVEKLKFKVVVSIAAGATLAVGGPAVNQGALILAVSRPKAP
jgi:hypothetical protein